MNWVEQAIDKLICAIRDSDRKPIEIAGSYWRWFVWPRNRFLNCYLHYWHGDDKQDLHDHRMANISIILQGGYYEERFVSKPKVRFRLPDTVVVKRRRFRLYFRLPSTPHRVILLRDSEGKPVQCWSLFIGGPHWRDWGFWKRGQIFYNNGDNIKTPSYEAGAYWVKFDDYVESSDPLSPGYGRRK